MTIYESGVYEEKNPTWHEEDAPWKAGKIFEILKDNQVECKTVCEIGCGTGEVLLNLGNHIPDAKLTGYEISPQAFARAHAKQNANTGFNLGNIFEKQDIDSFDVAMAIDVFEHVEDYIGFITSIKKIGRFKIFHIPLDLSVQSVLRSWPILNLRKDVGHLHYFTKDTAIATLEYCGHKVIDYRYTASRLELPNQVLTSRIMKLPRRFFSALNRDLAVRVLGGYSLLVLTE